MMHSLDLNQPLINKIKDSKILFDELSYDDLDSLTNTEKFTRYHC